MVQAWRPPEEFSQARRRCPLCRLIPRRWVEAQRVERHSRVTLVAKPVQEFPLELPFQVPALAGASRLPPCTPSCWIHTPWQSLLTPVSARSCAHLTHEPPAPATLRWQAADTSSHRFQRHITEIAATVPIAFSYPRRCSLISGAGSGADGGSNKPAEERQVCGPPPNGGLERSPREHPSRRRPGRRESRNVSAGSAGMSRTGI